MGELVRKSKTRTSWHFDLDDVSYCFELKYTKLTGKKKLLRNGCLIYEESSLKKQFCHEMTIAQHLLVFTQSGDSFDLRINNESFMFVYT